MANNLKIQESHPIDENLRPLKVGGVSSSLELSTTKARLNNLDLSGDIKAIDLSIVGLKTAYSDSTLALYSLSDMTLDTEGDLIVSGADVKITATNKIYLDGGGDTYFKETSSDQIDFYAGGDNVLRIAESGTSGNRIDFMSSCAGFTQFEPTYNATDTEVYFNRNGNKAFCTFGGNIADLNLYFPAVSCNCILLLKQDGTGSRLVTAYKTFDQAGGNESTVVWAGGSNPTLTTTANKLDILSFYWDNDNHKAYGVATLNF